MNKIQVILTVDTANLPDNFQEIVKHEQEILFKWKQEGIIEHLFLKQEKDGAVMILKDIDEAKARELVEALPLYQLKKSVEYFNLIQQF